MYKPDATTQQIINFLSVRPRRLCELQNEIGQLSAFGVINRMNILEIHGVVHCARSPEHKTTIYYLLSENENGKDGDGENVAIKREDTTNVSSNKITSRT